ncbi:DNA2/NAM7-like helicase like protein, partial [Aduncisulcus paluster]
MKETSKSGKNGFSRKFFFYCFIHHICREGICEATFYGLQKGRVILNICKEWMNRLPLPIDNFQGCIMFSKCSSEDSYYKPFESSWMNTEEVLKTRIVESCKCSDEISETSLHSRDISAQSSSCATVPSTSSSTEILSFGSPIKRRTSESEQLKGVEKSCNGSITITIHPCDLIVLEPLKLVTTTAIAGYDVCPKKNALFDSYSQMSSAFLPFIRGRLVHEITESIVKWLCNGGQKEEYNEMFEQLFLDFFGRKANFRELATLPSTDINQFERDVIDIRRQILHASLVFIKQYGKIIAAELPIDSIKLGIAGKIDLITRHSDGTIWICELKSRFSRYSTKSHRIQCLIYLILMKLQGINCGCAVFYIDKPLESFSIRMPSFSGVICEHSDNCGCDIEELLNAESIFRNGKQQTSEIALSATSIQHKGPQKRFKSVLYSDFDDIEDAGLVQMHKVQRWRRGAVFGYDQLLEAAEESLLTFNRAVRQCSDRPMLGPFHVISIGIWDEETESMEITIDLSSDVDARLALSTAVYESVDIHLCYETSISEGTIEVIEEKDRESDSTSCPPYLSSSEMSISDVHSSSSSLSTKTFLSQKSINSDSRHVLWQFCRGSVNIETLSTGISEEEMEEEKEEEERERKGKGKENSSKKRKKSRKPYYQFGSDCSTRDSFSHDCSTRDSFSQSSTTIPQKSPIIDSKHEEGKKDYHKERNDINHGIETKCTKKRKGIVSLTMFCNIKEKFELFSKLVLNEDVMLSVMLQKHMNNTPSVSIYRECIQLDQWGHLGTDSWENDSKGKKLLKNLDDNESAKKFMKEYQIHPSFGHLLLDFEKEKREEKIILQSQFKGSQSHHNLCEIDGVEFSLNSMEMMASLHDKLSTSQYKALIVFLSSKNRITFLQGPPGTGKTHLIHNIVDVILSTSITLPYSEQDKEQVETEEEEEKKEIESKKEEEEEDFVYWEEIEVEDPSLFRYGSPLAIDTVVETDLSKQDNPFKYESSAKEQESATRSKG